MSAETPLPDFIHSDLFPFEGDFRVKERRAPRPADHLRSGDPGGPPCSCETETGDDDYLWVDDHWRVRASHEPAGVPVRVWLESRAHLDLHELTTELQAELGVMICRLERAILAVGGIGRVHFSRWGDGGSHFHMWFYGRPLGDAQLLGWCLPMWDQIGPPIEDAVWQRNLGVVAASLVEGGGRVITPA